MFAIKYEIIHYIPGTAAYNGQNNILLWTYTPSDGQQQKINSKVIGLTGSLIVINSRVLTDQMSFSYFVINYLNSS